MCKCPVFSHFCCCCPLKVIFIICIFNNLTISSNVTIAINPNHPMKVGTLVIGLIYLISGLIAGLLFTIFAATLKPEDLEDIEGVVKISEGQVQNTT